MPYFRQLLHDETGCISYILGCPSKGVCAVVDPQADIEQYLGIARTEQLKITHVLETHVQADHLSGYRKLAEETGADVYLHEDADVEFKFNPVREGSVLTIGNQKVRVIHTPGHTPESTSLLFNQFILTGDTLFAGEVGRLDLKGAGTAEQLYHSVYDKLLGLADYLVVSPGHYGKSLCGKGLQPVPSSTLGYERRFNYALQAKSKEDFVRQVMEHPSGQPANYQRIKRINRGAS